MQKVKQVFSKLVLAAALTATFSGLALAANSDIQNGVNSAAPTGATNCLFSTQTGCSGTPIFQEVANTLIFIVGALAVIMLIVGGLRYVLSSGNSSAVEGAKNTILYALIGIVVAVLAFAAVNFVVSQFNK